MPGGTSFQEESANTVALTPLVLGGVILLDLARVRWMGDGMATLSAAEKAAAQETLSLLSVTCLDNPIPAWFVRHAHVAGVLSTPECPGSPSHVVIDVYTVFGLHMQRISHYCGTITCSAEVPD